MNSKIFGVELITGRSNSTIAKISKLENKKSRNEEKLFCLDGVKLFLEAYKFGAEIEYLIVKDDARLDEDVIAKIMSLKERTRLICVSEAVFSKLTEENAPQGIITVCKYLKNHRFTGAVNGCDEKEKIMVFESVRDPGNIGAIIRNAAAFGVDRLILSSDCADVYSQKVLRATMGAIFKVKIDIVTDLKSTLKSLKNSGRRVISTTLRNNSLKLGKDAIFPQDVFIIGNEGHGVSEETIEFSNETLFIPMRENTESLNASVAAAVLMWEQYKYNI